MKLTIGDLVYSTRPLRSARATIPPLSLGEVVGQTGLGASQVDFGAGGIILVYEGEVQPLEIPPAARGGDLNGRSLLELVHWLADAFVTQREYIIRVNAEQRLSVPNRLLKSSSRN